MVTLALELLISTSYDVRVRLKGFLISRYIAFFTGPIRGEYILDMLLSTYEAIVNNFVVDKQYANSYHEKKLLLQIKDDPKGIL